MGVKRRVEPHAGRSMMLNRASHIHTQWDKVFYQISYLKLYGQGKWATWGLKLWATYPGHSWLDCKILYWHYIKVFLLPDFIKTSVFISINRQNQENRFPLLIMMCLINCSPRIPRPYLQCPACRYSSLRCLPSKLVFWCNDQMTTASEASGRSSGQDRHPLPSKANAGLWQVLLLWEVAR